jgi:hypothetical protein
MANDATLIATRLVSALTGLTGYSGLVVAKQVFKPDRLPAGFSRYGVVVSPHPRPWSERRTAIREVQYTYRFVLYLLVANFDDTLAVFGESAPDKGVFEMVSDVKALLRTHTLSGLLDKTYDEIGGDVEFGSLATPAFDSGSAVVIHRATMTFEGRTSPFCHGK